MSRPRLSSAALVRAALARAYLRADRSPGQPVPLRANTTWLAPGRQLELFQVGNDATGARRARKGHR